MFEFVAVVDDRTNGVCLQDHGREIDAKEILNALPHVDLGDPEFQCRCVLVNRELERMKK